MEVSEENVESLCVMGFDRVDAQRALAAAKNDLNEAVGILTGDTPAPSSSYYDLDVEMKDTGCVAPSSSSTTVYGPSLPPNYTPSLTSSGYGGVGSSMPPSYDDVTVTTSSERTSQVVALLGVVERITVLPTQ